jgi:hypothetical protein
MYNLLAKPILELAKAIIAKVPPWVWAAVVLLLVWLGSLYAAVRITQGIDADACAAKALIAERKSIDDLSTSRMDIANLKDAHCQLRANLAACEATLAAKPVPPKVVVRRVPVREPEPESCE